MKKIVNYIFLFLLVGVLFYGFFNILPGYWSEHNNYYIPMLHDLNNWKILLSNFAISLVIVLFLFWSRKKIITLLVGIYISLLIFGWFYISYKGGFLHGKGSFMWLINLSLMYSLILTFLGGILTFGDFLKSKILKLDTKDIFGVVVNFGLGLVIFLLFNYLMILFNLVYTFFSWLVLLFLLLFSFWKRNLLIRNLSILEEVLKKLDFVGSGLNERLILMLLLLFSLMYLNFGFLMSWIPYPTAWDANHAYMFYPKMWALHHGFYWDESNMNTTPYLWLAYITFWFSLFTPFYDSFWISPDTFAVVMNFLSGILVLLFGLSLLGEFISFFSKYNKDDSKKLNLFFYLGRFFIILWLTSGMGAFLVFVDNKTDLGVLTMIILALYGGFLAFRKIIEYEYDNNISSQKFLLVIPYIIISALFFAVAVASKPTAFFDVVNFGIFVTANFLSIILAIGLIILAIGILSLLQFRGIVNYFTFDIGKKISLVGLIVSFIGIFEVFFKKVYNKIYLLVLWGTLFVIFLALIKGIWLVLEFVYYPDRFNSLKQIILTLFFG